MAIDWSIVLPPLCAGLLILASHVPLGQRVLERGIIFADIAVAQFAVLGVIAAQRLLAAHELPALPVQAAALGAAVTGALLLNWTEKNWPRWQEAVIGSAFVVTASLGVLLLAGDPHGEGHLRETLVGQILWTNYRDLLPLALVTAIVLAAWHGLRWQRSPTGFYLLFALAVTASVQIVGVYLVFASLILPALCTQGMRSGRTAAALGVGAAGYCAGLAGSARFDLPAGALIVCACAIGALAFTLLRHALRRRDTPPAEAG
jgi:zinc/manganese transport system permease protein